MFRMHVPDSWRRWRACREDTLRKQHSLRSDNAVCQIKNETTNVYSIFSSRIMYPFSIRLICTIFISVLLLYVSSRLSLICLNPPVSYTSVKPLSLDGQKGYTLSIGLNNHLSVLLSYAPPFKNFFSIHFISLYGR